MREIINYHKILDIILLCLVLIGYFYIGLTTDGISFASISKYIFMLILSIIFFGVGIIIAYVIVMIFKYGGILFFCFTGFGLDSGFISNNWVLLIGFIYVIFSIFNIITAYKSGYKTLFDES